MRRNLLLTTLFLMGCSSSGSGTGGPSGGLVTGRLVIFQGAGSAPVTPTLASLVPDRRPKMLEKIPVERWLKLVEDARPELLDRICEMVARAVKPEAVSFSDAVRLAMQPAHVRFVWRY